MHLGVRGWELRDHPNVQFLWYEELRTNIRDTIQQLAAFLNIPMTGEAMDHLAQQLQVESCLWTNQQAVWFQMKNSYIVGEY